MLFSGYSDVLCPVKSAQMYTGESLGTNHPSPKNNRTSSNIYNGRSTNLTATKFSDTKTKGTKLMC